MNGVSVGAVYGARATNDIYGLSNQENQGPIKAVNGGVQQRPASNQRVPLTNLPTDRIESGEYGQSLQTRTTNRVEDMASHKDKSRDLLSAEGLQHSYKRSISNSNLSNTGSDDIPENMYKPEKEETEGWIHREKLAKIENEELQAAGINLVKSRTKSRDALRSSSRDRLRNDFQSTDGNARDDKPRKVSSPIPQQLGDEEQFERSEWDLRSPEEIAAEQASLQAYATPVLRKSGSKIPVLTPSAHTSPLDERPERGESISRKRTMSGSSPDEDGLFLPKQRAGSSSWNENPGASAPMTSRTSSSPTKQRQKSISGMAGSSPGVKAGVPRKTSNSTRTQPSSNGRPRTRGNDSERPRTAVNPPEGDPPWLADMYKPDPRLPPEEQLIPTLAKKQRQQQWEQNGMVPKTYDRDFEPLAVHETGTATSVQPAQSGPVNSADRHDESEQWPLKPVISNRSVKESPSKSSATNTPVTTGGYSTMPKVSSPPMSVASPKIGTTPSANAGAPSPNIGPVRQASATPQQPIRKVPQRLQLDDEDEKAQKKGCGCCVVM